MSQPGPASFLWHRKAIAEIPSAQWTRWLDPANRPSPYLMPQWAQFWAQAWSDAQADVWITGDAEDSSLGVCIVSRRRFGHTWTFALPFGTPGGWLGTVPGVAAGSELLASLVTTLANRDTIQMALSIDDHAPDLIGWKKTTAATKTWILDLAGRSDAEIPLNLSDSHRRNIEKGAQHQPVIKPVDDRQTALDLFEMWPVPSAHRSRIVLNPALAPTFASVFALSPTMRWRTAWIGEKPVATSLWLVLHDRAVYVDGASVRDTQLRGVNHYLFHHILNELYESGIRYFDLGSGPKGQSSAGLARFKEGWGGTPLVRTAVVYRRPWYHWLRKLM